MGVVSPCWGGPATFPQRYAAGKRYIETTFGLELVEMPHALAAADWLDHNPAARADDLHRAFTDETLTGIIATIGGDDAIRLIPQLDLDVLRKHSKVFVGYSDCTAIHFACLKAGLVSFHGPTIMSGFAENGGMTDTGRDSFRRATFNPAPPGALVSAPEGWSEEWLDWSDPDNQLKPRARRPSRGLRCLRGSGRVSGRLIGGCAETLEMLKGTPWWPPADYWDGAILFYETSGEAPSATQVLRWLRNFAAQGILSRLSALLLGRAGGQISDAERAAQEMAVLRALDDAGLHDLPVIADLDIGHTDPVLTLPYGMLADVDCVQARVVVREPAVT